MMKCVQCSGNVVPIARPGRLWKYKKWILPVPADLLVRTCDNCGEEYFNASEGEIYDSIMEVAYQEAIKTK